MSFRSPAAPVVLVLLLANGPARAGIPPVVPVRRQAILVGADLPGSGVTRKLHELAGQLRGRFGYREADVVELYGADATQAALREALGRSPAETGARSLLVAVFLPVVVTERDEYLVPAEGNQAQPWTLIPVGALTEITASVRAEEKLMVLPSCPWRGRDPFQQSANQSVRPSAPVALLSFCPRRGAEKADVADVVGALLGALKSATKDGRLTARDAAAALSEAARDFEIGYSGSGYSSRELVFIDERGSLDRTLALLEPDQGEKTKVAAIQSLRDSILAVPADRRGSSLGRVGEALLQVARRGEESLSVRAQAVWALGAVHYDAGVPGLGALLTLEETPPEVRRAAVEALSRIGGDEVRRLVRGRLSDPVATVRLAAVRAAGELRDDDAIPIILDIVTQDAEADLRVAGLQTLSALPGLKARGGDLRARLGPVIQHPSPAVRREVIVLVGTFGPGPVPPELLDVLSREPDPSVRAAAAYAVGRMSQEGAERDMHRGVLLDALSDRDPAVREAAAWALGRVGGEKAVKRLTALLAIPPSPAESKERSQQETALRRTAAESLGVLGPASRPAVPALVQSLRGDEPEVRAAAAAALGRIGDAGAIDSLIAALKDADPYVRSAAESALGQVKGAPATGKRLKELVAALDDPSAAVRLEAVRRLRDTQDPDAVSYLIKTLGDEEADVREEASRALAGFRDAASIGKLTGALGHKSPLVRQGAVATLRTAGPEETLPRVAALYQDLEPGIVKAEVVRALAARAPARYRATLLKAAGDRDPLVRLAAVSALAGSTDHEGRTALESLARDPDSSVRQNAIEALQGFWIRKK